MKYTGSYLREISFPLGGIGTGSIGLAGNGSLVDWEIFNRPNKGSVNGYSHFAIRAIEDDKITARVINGDATKDYMGQYKKMKQHTGYGFGPDECRMYGFPHFENVEFDGEFPIAQISFADKSFPADLKMTAFNPFIPNDSLNSSIPAAFFEIEIENKKHKTVKYQIALSVTSPFEQSCNKAADRNGFNSITMYNNAVSNELVEYGDLTIATDCKTAYTESYWYRGQWKDNIVSFWNNFSKERNLTERKYDSPGSHDSCTLTAEVDINVGEKKSVRFVLSWNVPNNYNYWTETDDKSVRKPWKNYYTTVFENSAYTAEYSLKEWNKLYSNTVCFKNTLHSSTLPLEVIEAASANLSVLKSPTVLRLEDGSFYGWEGLIEQYGSCEGTCQHVWNYAYALCFLFPELERSIRDLEFKYCMDNDGRMAFRLLLPLERGISPFRACVDGQMGAVIKCYREWKLSGDSEWLKANWENIKKALEYAWSPENEDEWDRNKDGVLEGRQHHTLDMELFGPSSWLEGMYLAALKAAAEMATFLGDEEKEREYNDIFEKGYSWTKENLFNGKYFVQKVDVGDKSLTEHFNASDGYWNSETNQIKYQIANGSSIDQMLGQWHSNILGLGSIFDNVQISSALTEMMKNNFKPSMRNEVNPWRLFSLNDEAGAVMCAYPENVEKPKIPVPYCEETMTGFEYAFAGLLCSEGRIEDGLRVVRAIRNRFDGMKRNPWNEFECGSNYARAMASYALIPILSGFEFDMPNKHIGFKPYTDKEFKCIWSVGGAWGNIEICKNRIMLNVYGGEVELKSLGVELGADCKELKADGKKIDFEYKDGVLQFAQTVISESVEIML